MNLFLPPTHFKACAASETTTAANSALGSEGAKNPAFKGKGTCLPRVPLQPCFPGSAWKMYTLVHSFLSLQPSRQRRGSWVFPL